MNCTVQYSTVQYLDSFSDILHPLSLLLLRGGGHHQGSLAVVDVEAEVRPHARLAVHHLEVGHCQLAVHLELQAGLGGSVGVQQHVRKLSRGNQSVRYSEAGLMRSYRFHNKLGILGNNFIQT